VGKELYGRSDGGGNKRRGVLPGKRPKKKKGSNFMRDRFPEESELHPGEHQRGGKRGVLPLPGKGAPLAVRREEKVMSMSERRGNGTR